MGAPKKYLLIAFWLLVGWNTAAAASSPLITNIPGRTSISLDGTWRAIVDPYEAGLAMRLYENAKPETPRDLVEYDFDTSGTLQVPGDWNSQRTDLFFYEGPVWYRRSFSYHKREHSRVFVYFGAANYRASVYLNAQKLGDHEGGFTPFNFEITEQIREGDNFLVVEVNDQRKPENVPGPMTDFWNYGGLTRDVSLVEVPDIFIQDYRVQLAKGSLNEIEGWVILDGASAPQQVTLEIPEAGINSRRPRTQRATRISASLQNWISGRRKIPSFIRSCCRLAAILCTMKSVFAAWKLAAQRYF